MSALNLDHLPIPDVDETQIRRAGIRTADHVLQHPDLDPVADTRELLREIGVIPDPHALIRIHGHSRVAANQNRTES